MAQTKPQDSKRWPVLGTFKAVVVEAIIAFAIIIVSDLLHLPATSPVKFLLWIDYAMIVVSMVLCLVDDFRHRPKAVKATSATAAAPAPAPSNKEQDAERELIGILQRSGDPIATLLDLRRHAQEHTEFGMLSELLHRTGIEQWGSDGPRTDVRHLSYNGGWYLPFRARGVTPSDDDVDHVTALEGALNLWEILRLEGCPLEQLDQDALELAFTRLIDSHPKESDTRKLKTARMLAKGEDTGEWHLRVAYADFVEGLLAPYRVAANFQANVAEGIVCAEVGIPAPSCLSLLYPDDADKRTSAARGYALRLALLLARGAFESSPAVRHVVVNCRDKSEVLLSVSLDAAGLETFVASLRTEPLTSPLPDTPSLRFELAGDGWFVPVVPFALPSDEKLNPAERNKLVEARDGDAPTRVFEACGARTYRDLSVADGVTVAWNELAGTLGDSTTDAVSRLVTLRDSTDNPEVREACDRTSRALVDGTVDISDPEALEKSFRSGGSLDVAVERANRILESDDSPEQASKAVQMLSTELDPLMAVGTYDDSDEYVCRCFSSFNERVLYNRTVDDGGRKVRLVPDVYFNACAVMFKSLINLGRAEDALRYANELARVAPVSPLPIYLKVLALLNLSRTYEAEDVLKDAIGNPADIDSLARYFYRLAYVEWKLGRGKGAVACYERSLQVSDKAVDTIEAELGQLVSSDPTLSLIPSDQVKPTLTELKIPAGDDDAIIDWALDATVACTDENLFVPARMLLASVAGTLGSDAFMDVIFSLGMVGSNEG